jgi:cytochrome c-type biogenesis protein CcmH
MKLHLSSNKLVLIILYILIFLFSTIALSDAVIDDKVKKITSNLRCMTCQNQTIYDSDADFSKNIKQIVRQKIIDNQSEKEIINFLVTRYGEYIVFKPLFNRRNIFLWIFPFLIFALSFVFFIFRLKKNTT